MSQAVWKIKSSMSGRKNEQHQIWEYKYGSVM